MDAILNIYKPRGMTSFQCVSAVRRILGAKKVGHAGTLDPEASGVLPICVGKATKLIEFFLLCRKSYSGTIMFGVSTDTQDKWGRIIESKDPSEITESMIQEAASRFVGESEQIPPVFSAVKVGGVPMYKKARKGEILEEQLSPRKINIYDLKAFPSGTKGTHKKFNVPVYETEIDVECSRGTYIRTLCYDIGRSLNMPSCMSSLCRTSYGPFLLEDSIGLDELEDAVETYLKNDTTDFFVNGKIVFYAPEYILMNFPTISLIPKQARKFRNGQDTIIDGQQLIFGADIPLFPKPDKGIARLKYDDKLVGVVRFYVGTDSVSKNLDDALMVRPWKYMGGDDWDEYCKKL